VQPHGISLRRKDGHAIEERGRKGEYNAEVA
jgi:hypothetical protein